MESEFESSARGKVVLVVDDERGVRMGIGALLRQAGYGVLLAGSAPEALEMMLRHSVALVLSDLQMPGIDGLELLGHLTKQWPSVPVIFLTAHGSVPDAVRAVKAGARDFLLKPCERELLLEKIEDAIGVKLGDPLEASAAGSEDEKAGHETMAERLRTAEREALEAALRRARGSRSEAARRLGVSRRTLYYKLEAHGIASGKT